MVDSASANKHIPNFGSLSSEATSCSHANDKVRLVSLTGQVCAESCRDCANIVHTMLFALSCIARADQQASGMATKTGHIDVSPQHNGFHSFMCHLNCADL